MGDNSRKPVTIYLDEHDWDLLVDHSKSEKLSKSEILRRALRTYQPTVFNTAANDEPQIANG